MRGPWKLVVGLVVGGMAVHATPPSLLATPVSGASLGFGSPQPVLSSGSPRFQMRQSYTLSYAGGGGTSMSQGLYVNSMSYRLSDPLTMHLDVGMLNPLHSSGMQSAAAGPRAQFFLPRVGLEYRPSENFLFSLNYCQIPAQLQTSSWLSGASLYSAVPEP